MKTTGTNISSVKKFIILPTLCFLLLLVISPLLSPVISSLVPPLTKGECENCHTGFTPFILVYDAPYQVPQEYDFQYRIKVTNPWTHEIRDMQATLDISDCPEIQFRESTDFNESDSVAGSVGKWGTDVVQIEVSKYVKHLVIQLLGDRGLLGLSDLDLTLTGPKGGTWTSTMSGAEEEIILTEDVLEKEGEGTYTLVIEHIRGRTTIDYDLTIQKRVMDNPVMKTLMGDELGPGESFTYTWELRSQNLSKNSVKTLVTASAYYDHQDSSITDVDTYEESDTHELEVGNTYLHYTTSEKISFIFQMWSLGRLLGLVSLLLFIMVFLTGGNFSSINRILSDRKLKRIRWHCILSYLLIVAILGHLLTLYLGIYSGTWTGLYLGGISFILMSAISLTGIYKKQLVSFMGSGSWRRIHFWLSVAVIAGVVFHAVFDGTTLGF